ncbi:MAG: hypothetical protein ACR2NA_06100 [Solirubrobacterales bacterium]
MSGIGSIIASIIMLVVGIIAAIIGIHILLVVFEANTGNDIVKFFTDAAEFFADPFLKLFKLDNEKVQTAVNEGIAMLVYLVAGSLIARLLRRI